MNKEEKYTSLELSKKIYKLIEKKGIELKSEYYWWIDTIKDEYTREPELSDTVPHHLREYIEIYPALDTVELGVLLPEKIRMKTHCMGKNGRGIDMELCFGVNGKYGKFWIAYGEKGIITDHNYFEAKTEAEARGQMYFYLLDNDLL